MTSRAVTGLAMAGLLLTTMQVPTPTPPGQPDAGPGGKAYSHQQVRTTRLGTGAGEVYLFEPAEPTPAEAPVVMFGHGWSGMNPDHYGAWISHIVRRGFTVIYPRYQEDLRTPVPQFTDHALGAMRLALDQLRTPGHVPADGRGLALVGHSMGGLVATNLAVRATRGELPPPLALMVVTPGKTWPEGSPIAFPLDDVAQLPASLLLLAVVGEDDDFVGETDARRIYTGAVGVPAHNRSYVRLRSDDWGAPGLAADHRVATAPAPLVGDGAPTRRPSFLGPDGGRGPRVTDALDFYGTWKLLDGLLDAVFRGVHREYALGGTREQRYMGAWSDGTPVRELTVEEP